MLPPASSSSQLLSASCWTSLPDELLLRVAQLLPPNDVACGLRPVCRAAAALLRGAEHTTVHLSQRVPPATFAARWSGPHAFHAMPLPRRRRFLALVAASGALPNLELAARAAGCLPNEDTLAAAAGAGHLPACAWLRRQGCPLGWSVMAAAARGGHLRVCEWLQRCGCPGHPQVLRAALASGVQEMCEWAAAACACPGGLASSPGWALVAAVRSGHLALLPWLLQAVQRAAGWGARDNQRQQQQQVAAGEAEGAVEGEQHRAHPLQLHAGELLAAAAGALDLQALRWVAGCVLGLGLGLEAGGAGQLLPGGGGQLLPAGPRVGAGGSRCDGGAQGAGAPRGAAAPPASQPPLLPLDLHRWLQHLPPARLLPRQWAAAVDAAAGSGSLCWRAKVDALLAAAQRALGAGALPPGRVLLGQAGCWQGTLSAAATARDWWGDPASTGRTAHGSGCGGGAGVEERWARRAGCGRRAACSACPGARSPLLPRLTWLRARGLLLGHALLDGAAREGDTAAVEWLLDAAAAGGGVGGAAAGARLDPATCLFTATSAAAGCQPGVLRLLWSRGLLGAAQLRAVAEAAGGVPVLEWVCEVGGAAGAQVARSQPGGGCTAVLTGEVMRRAAARGDAAAVQWLLERGCPWDERTLEAAAQGGSVCLLQALCAGGCARPGASAELAYAAARHNGDAATVAALIRGGVLQPARLAQDAGAGARRLAQHPRLREVLRGC